MALSYPAERHLLRTAIALGGLVPVSAGLAGVMQGHGLFGLAHDLSGDSHVRYISGLLLGIGLAFWASIPAIERHTARIRLLTALVVLGGAARLAGALASGTAEPITWLALAMELLVTPLLCLWQMRVARRAP